MTPRRASGFLVANKRIVTNAHVVERGNIVVDLGQARIPATLEKIDRNNDLALLSVQAELRAPPLKLSDTTPIPGETVFAIGNPEGLQKTISHGVSSGVRQFEGQTLLQVSTPISHGSSGGPVFNAQGDVVGVTVGALKNGQNLNFAVPVAILRTFLTGSKSTESVADILKRIASLKSQESEDTYSAEPDSSWQKRRSQIDDLLTRASSLAWQDPGSLIEVSESALYEDNAIVESSARRSLALKETPEAHILLSKALQNRAIFAEPQQKTELLKDAEGNARSAVSTSKTPTAEIYYTLADVLEDEEQATEAGRYFERAFSASHNDTDLATNSIRGLVRTNYTDGKYVESQKWFEKLVSSGAATAYDWYGEGGRLAGQNKFAESAAAYERAANLGSGYMAWCQAEAMYSINGDDDSVLRAARNCIEKGTGIKNSETHLATAHRDIADVLNNRGVYSEALTHAREATGLNDSDAFSFDSLAQALIGLHRPQEAVNAAQQAIRLSDGKWSSMHFHLSTAYFDMENWQLAQQSFEKAAELNAKDAAASYNVALCLVKLGFYRDAARWYEEVLRRNPNHPDREDIRERINILRR
jgi:tetratricopeptide (TPR) repeat protein